MSLLNPAALGFAALAPLIVLLYLLKIRRRPAQVSTLMFWHRVTADHRRHALFQRLRHPLSLLLHLLIFALLLFALAHPEFATFRGTEAGLSTVVIVDARARMQARTSGNRTRFEQARRLAEAYLHRASVRQPVALLAAESEPRLLVGLSDEEKPLFAGLASIQPTDAGGRIEDTVSLAGELLAGRSGAHRIVVITDHPLEPTSVAPGEIETHLVGTGETASENVGITRLSARPLPDSPQTNEVFVEIENFGARRQTGNVELSYEGRLVDVKPFDLAPGESHAEVYPSLAAHSGIANARGWLTAHLDLSDKTSDAFALDNDAFAVVPPPRPVRVLLVTRGNWFLENLLKADDAVRFEQLALDAFQPAQAAGFDAVILDDFLPAAFGDDPASLPPGNFLFLRRAPLPTGGPGLTHPLVTELDAASPLLRFTDLRDVTFLHAAVWLLPEGTASDQQNIGGWRYASPVRTGDHPLIITGERLIAGHGSQRFVATAFGAADSDLPLRVAFPLFIHNTLGWLAGREPDPASTDGIRAGENFVVATGSTLWSRPQREYLSVGAIPATESIAGPGLFQPTRNGFYLVTRSDGTTRWVAVNTFDRTMSALNATALAPLQSGAPVSVTKAFDGWATLRIWPPWVYLAVTAFVLCALEWWGFHRRLTE